LPVDWYSNSVKIQPLLCLLSPLLVNAQGRYLGH